MKLEIKVKINQSGNRYLAITTLVNNKDLVLNFDSFIIMRLLDVSPNQIDKIVSSRDYDNLNLLDIKDEIKKL